MSTRSAGRRLIQTGLAVLAAAAVLSGLLTAPVPAEESPAGVFPLRIGPNRHYFVDGRGEPFLVQGDAAWSLIAQLTPGEAETYLARRRSQGFNAVLVNLIEHKFARNAPRNASGDEPFLKAGDLSTPNEAYFARAETIIEMAGRQDMAVFLVPAYLGWGGGDEGWFRELRLNGRAKLRSYGRYVGRRLGRHANIIWVAGGDYTPSWLDRWTVDALAEGLRESGARQLMTAHCGLGPAARIYGRRPWLDFDNVYTYEPDVFAACADEYRRRPPRPFVLSEAFYEGEHDTTAETLRRQACAALLAGATGQFFGNNPVWNFDAPVKVCPSDRTWPAALDSRGAREISLIGAFFRDLRWPDLVPLPARGSSAAGSGPGRRGSAPLAAASDDGGLLVAYLSGGDGAGFQVDLDRLSRPGRAFWVDPTTGERREIDPSLFSGQGLRTIPRPATNAGGAGDWLMVFQAAGTGAGRTTRGEERGR
jgi:hypothetical protein